MLARTVERPNGYNEVKFLRNSSQCTYPTTEKSEIRGGSRRGYVRSSQHADDDNISWGREVKITETQFDLIMGVWACGGAAYLDSSQLVYSLA